MDYAGAALFQVSNGSSTVDAPQNTNHTVNLTPAPRLWDAASNSTDGNGVQTSTNCTYSKIYDGSGNDNTLVPNAFGGTAAPYAIEAATGLPILETTGTQSYTLASDGNAVGFTGGTAALSVIYNGKQDTTGYCCGPVGIGHNHAAPDVFGTTFYISAAYGFNGNQSNNNCATSTTFCTGADEESINDFADYAYSNIGSIFAITNWGGSGTNVVKNYINGGLVSTASPPAASLCGGCSGIDLPGSIHACAGGDLSGPAHCLVREFGFANGATTADSTAYANATNFFSGLTYANYVPPSTAVSVVQSKVSQTAGPGTSATATFSSATGTSKHGVAVGLTWCSATGCGTATGDVFASGAGGIAVAGGGTQHMAATSGGAGTVETATLPAGTTAGNLGIIALGWCGNNSGNCNPATVSDNAEDVAIGTSACTEVPGTYSGTANGGSHGASVIFVCPNLNASQSVCTATFPSTVYYETVACTEVSGALTVSPAEVGNNNAGISGTPSITTNGNVSSSGEFIYSFINDLAGDTVTAGQTVINTNVASSKDEYQIGSSSGITYTNTWTGNSGSSKVQSIVGIIPTSSSPGTVTVGSNACTEVPSSFFSGSGVSGTHYQGEIWNCPNLAAAGTLVTATTAGTSVEDLGITADELSCPTSGCTLDGTADGGTGLSPGTFWFCNATTSGNLAASGEFLYSVGMASVPLYAHGHEHRAEQFR